MTDSTDNPLAALSRQVAALTVAASPHVVSVHSQGARSSGFFWQSDLVVTADEALAEAGDIEIGLPDGATTPARVVGRDPTTDIALLRLDRPGTAVPARLSVASTPEVGSFVVSLGRKAEGPLAALGMVSLSAGPWRSMRGGDITARLELDLKLTRAGQGSLVLDPTGQALGMAVFGPRRRVLVIPGQTIERVAGSLAAHGRIPRGYLGLAMRTVRLDAGGSGAIVISVDPAGPGHAAGVKQGDILVRWNGSSLTGLRSAMRGLGSESVGTMVTLSIIRGGEPLDLQLEIGERPGR